MIVPIGPTIEWKPPLTFTWRTANGGLWIHYVDADGKPAGGNWNGIEYNGDVSELLEKIASLEDKT